MCVILQVCKGDTYMAKLWLTEQLDRQPFSYQQDKVQSIFSTIDKDKAKLQSYWASHPDAYQSMVVHNDRRHLQCALSFLALEDRTTMDMIPTAQKNEIDKLIEEEKIKKARAYQEACEYVHRCALGIEKDMKNCGLEANLLIKAHSILCSYDAENYRSKARPRFRNADDGLIIIGRGTFNPVDGDLVDLRMERLFSLYNIEWYHEPALIKGVKFLVEYIRIQPHLDGNKRVALMALNFVLEKEGYPSIYLDGSQYEEFVQLVDQCLLSRDITPLVLMLASIVERVQQSLQSKIILYRTTRKIERLEHYEEPIEQESDDFVY